MRSVTNTPALPLRRRARAMVQRADLRAFLPDRGRPPTDRPAVGLVGFYGSGNYGDELFLEVFRQHLTVPIRLHTVLDPEREVATGAALRKRVRHSDVLVIGGGDLVIPWRPSRYWRDVFLQRPLFIAGVGVPAWREPVPEVVKQLTGFFGHPSVRSIAARDPESAAWIRERLAPAVPVIECPDLACALDLPPVTRPSDPPIFGVAVRHRSPPDDLSHVRQMCERARAMGYRLRRIVLATGPLRAVDLETTLSLGFDDSELITSDDLGVISRAIGECTLLASMKFHGVVVAAMYGVPSIILMPTTKTLRFAGRIGRPDLICAYSDPGLPDLITADPSPVPADLSSKLRADARDYLGWLRSRVLETASIGSRPAR